VEQLLSTKLFIPTARQELVHRPRLIERLDEGLHRKLTLISAPAGFGKTTLVTEWLDSLRLDTPKEEQTLYRITWFSLDKSDNDPARFLSYLISALNPVEGVNTSIGEGALSMIHSPQPPPPETILTSVINDISSLSEKIILIIDDYHLIESQQVHDALAFLLDHLPRQIHMVIATREDPPLLLGRLRARDQLTELRAANLRFNSSEAAEFLNQVMTLNLSDEDLDLLENRTEGWIAGLQLAAISLRDHEDATSLIKAFSGSHRLVLDFLIEEVLNQQSECIQNFLLKTAILDRLTGSLCDALTDQDNGGSILQSLEHANLFIVPQDDERYWYRYHHLFADSLRRRLNQIHIEQVPVLHSKASVWYEKNGFIDDAIDHALRGKDFVRMASLVDAHIDAFWKRGQHGKLRQWLVELPVEIVIAKPQLCIFRALYSFTSGQLGEAERDLQSVEQVLESSEERTSETSVQDNDVQLSSADKMKLRGRLAAVRAFMGSYIQKDVQGIIKHSQEALEFLPESDVAMRTIAAIALGDAQAIKGDMSAAYLAQSEALDVIRSTGNVYFILVGNLKLANILREKGKLQHTVEICSQMMDLAKKSRMSHSGIAGWLLAIWGEALAELNDLDKAVTLAMRGVELHARGGDVAMLCWSYLCLMRVYYSQGNLTGIEECFQTIDEIGRESNLPPWFIIQKGVWQTRLWLAQDNLESASNWIKTRGLVTTGGLKPQHEQDYSWLLEHIGLARVLIALGHLDESDHLLQILLETAEAGYRITRVMEILLLRALTLQSKGNTTQAITVLERALALAEPNGFFRTIVDEGPSMAHLLFEAFSRDIAPDYVQRLLAAFPIDQKVKTDQTTSRATDSKYVESLSDREIEVLQLVAQGRTNPEIAEKLYLSQHTVKVHARNIYGKLGVHNRTEAVNKARALGILPNL